MFWLSVWNESLVKYMWLFEVIGLGLVWIGLKVVDSFKIFEVLLVVFIWVFYCCFWLVLVIYFYSECFEMDVWDVCLKSELKIVIN